MGRGEGQMWVSLLQRPQSRVHAYIPVRDMSLSVVSLNHRDLQSTDDGTESNPDIGKMHDPVFDARKSYFGIIVLAIHVISAEMSR